MMRNVIVLPGCGSNIVYFLGYLLKNKNIINFDSFVGISSGSILCLLLSLDIPLNHIFYIFYNNNILKPNFTSLFDLKNFMDNIFTIFDKKNIKRSITFSEFFTKYNKNLNFVCYDIESKKEKIFNYNLTPDVRILDSVAASCSLPIIFDNVVINNVKYIDGIFYDYSPIELLPRMFNNFNNIKFHIFNFGDLKKSHLEFIKNNQNMNYILHKINCAKNYSIFASKKDLKIMLILGFFNKEILEDKYILNYEIYFYAIKNLILK